jgi:hypothetical protein
MKKTIIVLFAMLAGTGLFAQAYKVGGIGPSGGYVFYDKGFSSNGWQYLEAAPAEAEFAIKWGPDVDVGGTAVVVGSGIQNTNLIVDALGNNDSAARRCANLNIRGNRGWFLPSRDELDLMYNNLKKQRAYGGFLDGNYWSSSNASRANAAAQNFTNGQRGNNNKNSVNNVRAVRAFDDNGGFSNSGGNNDGRRQPPRENNRNDNNLSNAIGGGGGSGRSYSVGDIGPSGGYVFYDKGFSSNGWQYLEVAPPESEFLAKWGPDVDVGGTAVVVGSGKQNTDLIIEALGNNDSVARRCANLNIRGNRGWFLPSRDELNLMYTNLKKNGIGNFDNVSYWSSSNASRANAAAQNFANGQRGNTNKGTVIYVRAIRGF